MVLAPFFQDLSHLGHNLVMGNSTSVRVVGELQGMLDLGAKPAVISLRFLFGCEFGFDG